MTSCMRVATATRQALHSAPAVASWTCMSAVSSTCSALPTAHPLALQRRSASSSESYDKSLERAARHPQRWPQHPDLKPMIEFPPPQASYCDLSRPASRWNWKRVTAPWEITETDRKWWLVHAQLKQVEESSPLTIIDGVDARVVHYLRALGVQTIRDLARVTLEEGRVLCDTCACRSIFVSIEHAKVVVGVIDKIFKEQSMRDYGFLRTNLPPVVFPTDVMSSLPSDIIQKIPHRTAPGRVAKPAPPKFTDAFTGQKLGSKRRKAAELARPPQPKKLKKRAGGDPLSPPMRIDGSATTKLKLRLLVKRAQLRQRPLRAAWSLRGRRAMRTSRVKEVKKGAAAAAPAKVAAAKPPAAAAKAATPAKK